MTVEIRETIKRATSDKKGNEGLTMRKLIRQREKDIQKLFRMLLLGIYDAFAVILSAFLALFVRFDFRISAIGSQYLEHAFWFVPLTILLTYVIFSSFHLYNSLWAYVSVREMFYTICAGLLVVLTQTVLMTVFDAYYVPRSYHFIFAFFFLFFTLAVRFSYRFIRIVRHRLLLQNGAEGNRIMLIGAGDAGRMIINEANHSEHVRAKVVCAIDDDEKKHGTYIRSVPIVGGRACIPEMVEKYDINQIVLAMPSITMAEQKGILEICKDTGCGIKILPGIYQFLNNEVSVSKLRDVQIEDLLGREPVKTNLDIVLGYVQGKTILVTGGGGSIGSELCRQIAAHDPKELIVFDIYENTTYDLQQELRRKFPDLTLTVLIGSVRNTHRVEQIFEKYRPDIVFHAAAHKHVPLMEASPNEAIKNNVFGTLNCARSANRWGTKRFVLISTDKAVNPTNIMGATKRICEMIIQAMARTTQGTEYVAVRFGNVLGSNGSVIPLFREQIAEGGPVTVTDKNIIRYFMTIPEAVSLVLQAGAYAKGGEIFVLDMGEPVKIDDLARNLIKLSGLEPDRDIRIVYTGLRPGEKLYEEMLMEEEGLQDTENNLIHIGRPIEFDDEQFFADLVTLKEKAYEDNGEGRKMVQHMVPTYQVKDASCIEA